MSEACLKNSLLKRCTRVPKRCLFLKEVLAMWITGSLICFSIRTRYIHIRCEAREREREGKQQS